MITLLSRPGCHLCDEALRELQAWLDRHRTPGDELTVEVVDIESDPELHRRYLERIPVIRVDGRDVCEFAFDSGAFQSALRDRRRKSGPGRVRW